MTFLPTLRFFKADFFTMTFAIPLELIFALYVLPLNLKVTILFLRDFFKLAFKTNLDDFLIFDVFKEITCFTLTFLDNFLFL